MAKKLRDSAYVNDLVLYRNACEEKKLKFTLSQLENLKSVYSRQKEQEKMFFAVQHMAVPVKTDPVILNLRKSLEKKSNTSSILSHHGEESHSARSTTTSRVTFIDEKLMENSVPNSNPGRIGDISSHSERSSRVSAKNKNVNQKPKSVSSFASTSSNNKNKLRPSIRVISPSPKRLNDMNSGKFLGSAGKKKVSHFDATPATDITSIHDDDFEEAGESIPPENQDYTSTILKSYEDKLVDRRSSSWNKDDALKAKRFAYAPRLSDLPPLDINIYENPCSEREAKERWQKIVHVLKNSSLEETRSEAELLKYKQEVRKKWQNSYNEIKKDRITAMIKDKMKMNEGEQLTLVKFLPKSRQSNFIKEAQLAQHKM